MGQTDCTSRIETKLEVRAYIQNLKYALDNNCKVTFKIKRIVDDNRDERYTNRYTVADLFQDENPTEAVKREIRTLTVADYIKTVRDIKYPKKSEMREFGKVYNGTDDVYIKIRVELLGTDGNHNIFIMSFHYAEIPFTPEMFPYRK